MPLTGTRSLASKPRGRGGAFRAAAGGGQESHRGCGPAPHRHTGDLLRFTAPHRASGFHVSLAPWHLSCPPHEVRIIHCFGWDLCR